MKTIRLEMRYDKKGKQWYGIQRVLKIHDKKDCGYRVMTEEKQYDLIWNECDFLYWHTTQFAF